MKKHLAFLAFTIALLSFLSCEKIPLGHDSDYLAIPVGRSFLHGSSVDVSISGQDFEGENSFDSCGGYWLFVHKSMLPASLLPFAGRLVCLPDLYGEL